MALRITVDGQVAELNQACYDENGEVLLESMQKAVGGFIKAVLLSPEYVRDGKLYRWLIVNEEGKLLALPHNPLATAIYQSTGMKPKLVDDVIVGTALLLEENEIS